MKRRFVLAAAAVLAIAAAYLVLRHRSAATGDAAQRESRDGAHALPGLARPRVDPRTLDRASIAGAIRDVAGAPIAGARVCVDLDDDDRLSGELAREPRCAVADAAGRYAIGELFAARYSVGAMARSYLPASYHPDGDRHRTGFELRAGEHRTDIDIVLHKGGVEITGTVADIAGGPIAHALVRASAGWFSSEGATPAVETDDAGAFRLWVRPGRTEVTAVADGYAKGTDSGSAPGTFKILLTPESSLAGTVVDARTGAPMSGVRVELSGGSSWGFDSDSASDITDDAGHFRMTRLAPGRYAAIARSPGGYGRSEGSVRVGLAQHVEGVIVKLYPAMRVTGRIVLPDAKRSTCPDAWLSLHEPAAQRYLTAGRDPDGSLHVDGVLPGSYEVNVWCRGFHPHDHYPKVVVKDKDVLGLEWEVDDGAVIRGRVVTRSGDAVEAATVIARSTGGDARERTGWATDQSQKDGTYKLDGLQAGEFHVDVYSDKGLAPKDGWKIVLASAAATVDQELVLEDGGTIEGTVGDDGGTAVGGVHVRAHKLGGEFEWGMGQSDVRSNDDGSFSLPNVRTGDYRVVASRGEWGQDELRKPGTTDDAKQGEPATVRPGATVHVRLVVESIAGAITGTVVDADGKPVTDAFVSASRESDAAGSQHSAIEDTRWTADDRPVLTGTDGSFKLARLSPGSYTVLAQRKGGGEAFQEHVAVGSVAKLQMKPTASIEGTAHRDGGAPDELSVAIADPTTGFSRDEQFFRTGGAYALHDLPAGKFVLTYSAEGAQKQQTVTVAEGEHKTGVDIELDPLVTITGRVVELGTQTPAPGLMVLASAGKSEGFSFMNFGDDDRDNISDDTGRFTVKNAPSGVVTLTGWPKDFQQSPYGFFRTVRTVGGTGTIDVGDIGVVHRRVKPGDPVGELGVHWADQPPGADVDAHVWQVSWIDPAGPAAKTDLKVGDIVTTIDGVDVTGANATNGWILLQAPPATVIHLGLARGVAVAVTLAPPS